MPDLNQWEPLLPDDRVGKIAQSVRLTIPTLPHDTEFVSFIVPAMREVPRDRVGGASHERGCLWPGPCDCDPLDIPAQAVFSVLAPSARGKKEMVNSGMPLSRWRAVEKARRHYVATNEDPAWAPFAIAAKGLVGRLKSISELM